MRKGGVMVVTSPFDVPLSIKGEKQLFFKKNMAIFNNKCLC